MSDNDAGGDDRSPAEWFVGAVSNRSKLVVGVILLISVVLGAGMGQVSQESSLEQFSFDSEAERAQTYVDENFTVEENVTRVQIVFREEDGNVLSRESFIESIELQRAFRDDPQINATLAEDPFADLGSVVATTAITQERAEELDVEERRAALAEEQARLNETAGALVGAINETRDLQRQYAQLNASYARGEVGDEEYQRRSAAIEANLTAVEQGAAERLTDQQAAAFSQLLSEARSIESQLVETRRQYQAGEITEAERDRRVADLQEQLGGVYAGVQTRVLGPAFQDLAERAEALQSDAESLRNVDPSLEEQREQLESMSDEEVREIVEQLLAEDGDGRGPFVFVPTDFEPGSVETDARTMYVTQETSTATGAMGSTSESISDTQLEMDRIVDGRFGDRAFTFGSGIVSDEINRSMTDSLAIVLPLALLFVLLVLIVAYRDVLDILLGMLGIVLVLVWTVGFMGWAQVTFNQIMVAVPVLLVGLSIDYAIHVFMRHREHRADGDGGSGPAMRVALLGVGAALLWVTITAMIGFLSNLVSPLPPIQDFGIVSAFGIGATLLIYGTFVPAAKVELDDVLESRGWDRTKRAFGTGGGAFSRFLAGGETMARRIPVVVVAIALLLTAGGVYGATQVDTSFQQEDFLADDPPEWTGALPAPFAPGEYQIKEQLDFVNDRFVRQGANTQILLRGEVTDDDALERIADAEAAAADHDVVAVLSNGEARVDSPLSAMEAVAASNESFNETFVAADTDGNGVPDENLTAVYDAFYEAAPNQAGSTIHRTDDGDYEALLVTIGMQGDATSGEAADATRALAEDLRGDGLEATATGQFVVFNVVEEELFSTVIDTLIVTFVAVFAFLMIAYRWVHGSALLGAITLTPILLTVAWILGTMWLLGVPFNVITGTITSLTIGLGVAYNIHVSERYRLELSRGHDVWEAMYRAVTGTGGALLGSAGTTVGGFGVLAFAILPPLQQFGIITGITIVYAFLGSVFVLPSFLALWTKYLGPAEAFERDTEAAGAAPVDE